jgi:hypothetical protein
MKYALERIKDVIDELEPLIQAHYKEIAKYQDIPLKPDWKSYESLDELGLLRIFTLREEGELIGYAVFMVRPHLHYMTCLTAFQDILFIKSDKRGKGLKFILWCDNQLKGMGINLIVQHVKSEHNFGPALERIGYELMDLIYTKRIK